MWRGVAIFVFGLLPVQVLGARDDLQSTLNDLMRDRPGAVLVSDPRTGRVLAVWNARAAFGRAYSPGSSAKIVAAAAAMEERVIAPSDRILCRRVPELLGDAYHCSHPAVGAAFTLESAFANSCNYFFSALSLRLTPSALAHWFAEFGFGSPVELPGLTASAGRVRVSEASAAKARAALGEGDLLVTPAQLLVAYAAIANGGVAYRPWRASRGGRKVGRVLRRVELEAATWAMLRASLEECVRAGTGQGAAVAGIRVAGKTGTAATGGGATHAWFAGYAPADRPEVALVVFLERGTGARDAAPLAGQILRHYFSSRHPKP